MPLNQQIVKKLQQTKISHDFDLFQQAVSQVDSSSYLSFLSILCSNNDNEEYFKLLLCSLIDKCINTSDNTDIEYLMPSILQSLERISNPVSVLFLLIENLSQKKNEVSRLKVIELLSRFSFNTSSIINLLYKPDTDSAIVEILKNKTEMIDEFIRDSVNISNPTVVKNLSTVLPSLDTLYFVNYNHFLFLFEHESHYMRNCLLDILSNLVVVFKESENIEAIKEITTLVAERLCDTNFYTRSKAISAIGELFKKDSILKDQRNAIIQDVMQRVKDKTVIVRKKSISLLGQILLNHPFKDKKYLIKLDPSTSQNLNVKKMEEDYNEFVNLMEKCLSLVVSLLDFNLKTDLLEISTFIKIAYLLKLNGSKEGIQKMLGLVFTKDKDIIIDVFKEILQHRSEILFEYMNDKAFEVILSNLTIDEKVLLKNIFNNSGVEESLYVLKQINKKINDENALELLQHITSLLFSSKDENQLNTNLRCYISTLSILRNLNTRIDPSHDILNLVIKNAAKMVFYHRTVIKHTVTLVYSISSNPEKSAQKLMKILALSKSKVKVLDAAGWIGLSQFYLLERMERFFKSGNSTSLVTSDGFRKSLENMGNVREKRKSLEETRKNSLGRLSLDKKTIEEANRLSLKFGEIEEKLKNKTDEEISDFFFYLKEKELLYSKSSFLHQIVPIIRESLTSENQTLCNICYSTMYRFMLISNDFFSENTHLLAQGLNHSSLLVRNTSIAAIHDFLIFYNTQVDPNLLFDKLSDSETAKNALLVIFDLLQKNIIRIKNCSMKITELIFCPTLGSIAKSIIKSVSNNSNIISIFFYEAYISPLSVDYIKFLSEFIPQNIQESMFMKCLKSNCSVDKLKAVYESFSLNEKFVKENMFREEMKQIVQQKAE